MTAGRFLPVGAFIAPILVLCAVFFTGTPVAQTQVTLAPLKILPMPKPTSMMPKHDTLCPFFLKSDISGSERVEFWYEGAKSSTDVAVQKLTVLIEESNVPTARPSGPIDRPVPWELRMSKATYEENRACLPPISASAEALK